MEKNSERAARGKIWFEMKGCELQFKNYGLRLAKFFLTLCIFGGAIISLKAQSTSADFPTPVTTNEISGSIKARDIGDARLTSYYYVFNGAQGDVFINVESNNFNGDIDVFAAEDLRPLSKIRLFADASPTETGRIVYLRQPLELILRVEGRTPDDNPATFRIKFAGSFAAYQGDAENAAPAAPEVKTAEEGAVKVNSVGTIIAEKKETKASDENQIAEKEQPPKAAEPEKTAEESKMQKSITENATAENKNESDNEKPAKTETETKSNVVKNKRPPRKSPKPVKSKSPSETTESEIPPPANPLENVHLIVLMKDGEKIEYPMTEVFRFSLNNNVLTIVLKDGKIERRSILDIQKFSVE
ncbi:MAG: cell envelope integrity protein TolA [Pyrinomonadaceae bacterium]